MKAADWFAWPESLPFQSFFPGDLEPWEWVKAIKDALASDLWMPSVPADMPSGVIVKGEVYFDPTVKLPAFASIEGPCYIGPGSEIRPGAFIRGNVIAGANCVLGNSCEFKNCLLLDRVQVPHFSYVGDSLLGNGAHLGAGVICSNLRLDQGTVIVQTAEGRVNTGMRKLGAILGDAAEAGCNAVLQPGALLGPKAMVFPSMAFAGYLEPNTIARIKPQVVKTQRR